MPTGREGVPSREKFDMVEYLDGIMDIVCRTPAVAMTPSPAPGCGVPEDKSLSSCKQQVDACTGIHPMTHSMAAGLCLLCLHGDQDGNYTEADGERCEKRCDKYCWDQLKWLEDVSSAECDILLTGRDPEGLFMLQNIMSPFKTPEGSCRVRKKT